MTDTAYQRVQLVAEAADKRKALGLTVLDVRGQTIVCDYFLVCHGRSLTHVEAIAEGVEELLEEHGLRPLRRSQPADAKWIVLDYGDVVAHVFTPEARGYYDLEGLWSQAEVVELTGLLPDAPVDDGEDDEE